VSAKKNRCISFIDHLTKYAEAVPIPDATTEACARAYATQIVPRHGPSAILVTDQGPNFMSTFFRETCKILGVKHLHTTAYHPQANGNIEKFHRKLNSCLQYYVNASGTNWDTLLPFYLMAYNVTPHSSTSYSAYYMLHEREITLPTSQGLKAKLASDAKDTEIEPR
jgi:transposase InsO family protein